jgi:hypothetical protein
MRADIRSQLLQLHQKKLGARVIEVFASNHRWVCLLCRFLHNATLSDFWLGTFSIVRSEMQAKVLLSKAGGAGEIGSYTCIRCRVRPFTLTTLGPRFHADEDDCCCEQGVPFEATDADIVSFFQGARHSSLYRPALLRRELCTVLRVAFQAALA